MRMKLEFFLDDNKIEYDYRRIIISFFKKTLETYNEDIKEIVYGIGSKKEMCFSPFFKAKEFKDGHIILENGKLNIFISFNDKLLGIHFFNALLGMINKEFRFRDNVLKLEKVSKVEEKNIKTEEVVFKLLSPLVIREILDNRKSWYHYLDEKGLEILKKNLIYNLKEKFPVEYIEKLEIVPLDIRKVIVEFYGLKIQSTLGTIRVKGKKEILEYLYRTGLSTSKKSAGFNMLDVVDIIDGCDVYDN